jgi:nuclear protein localization family protein 4
MVDHVEFESASIVDNFISYWRSTGVQRLGFLYGRYERYDEVPLGVKAVVSAIYEPPQTSGTDGVELTNDANIKSTDTNTSNEVTNVNVDEMAKKLGLRKIGMIYTDLMDDGSGSGKVVRRRHADSFFLSSAECEFIASMQLQHPNISRHCPEGHFGSRFITVVVSGP